MKKYLSDSVRSRYKKYTEEPEKSSKVSRLGIELTLTESVRSVNRVTLPTISVLHDGFAICVLFQYASNYLQISRFFFWNCKILIKITNVSKNTYL